MSSSCTVVGTRQDISGLEKTLHYLLEKWRVQHSVKAEGHTEWFFMDCFEKAVEIITYAAKLRGLKTDDPITHEMTDNIRKKHRNTRRTKASYESTAKFDDLEQQWPYYEKGTLDFRDHPYIEGLWLWTLDISECLIHPLDAMRFKANGAGINLASGACCHLDKPSIVQIGISKDTLVNMKKTVIFRQVYEFASDKIKGLIPNNFTRPESFDIESTPIFQNRP